MGAPIEYELRSELDRLRHLLERKKLGRCRYCTSVYSRVYRERVVYACELRIKGRNIPRGELMSSGDYFTWEYHCTEAMYKLCPWQARLAVKPGEPECPYIETELQGAIEVLEQRLRYIGADLG